jgi:hypothetical protein
MAPSKCDGVKSTNMGIADNSERSVFRSMLGLGRTGDRSRALEYVTVMKTFIEILSHDRNHRRVESSRKPQLDLLERDEARVNVQIVEYDRLQ